MGASEESRVEASWQVEYNERMQRVSISKPMNGGSGKRKDGDDRLLLSVHDALRVWRVLR